jgi:hypothetical protein
MRDNDNNQRPKRSCPRYESREGNVIRVAEMRVAPDTLPNAAVEKTSRTLALEIYIN